MWRSFNLDKIAENKYQVGRYQLKAATKRGVIEEYGRVGVKIFTDVAPFPEGTVILCPFHSQLITCSYTVISLYYDKLRIILETKE